MKDKQTYAADPFSKFWSTFSKAWNLLKKYNLSENMEQLKDDVSK